MCKKLIITGLIFTLAAGPVFAAKSASKQEAVGVGAGATIGAVVGGPVGLMIGAAIGAKLGDSYHRKNEQIGTLSESLAGSNERIGALQGDNSELHADIDSLGTELQRMQALARPDLLRLMQAGIEMDLLFRTDEDVLTDTTGSRVAELAASLARMPEIQLRLDGFADERGDAGYNQGLSARRVEHVRDLLLANGIPASRIQHTAHGESIAAEATVDSYALERKVSVTLYIDEAPSLALNPR